MKLESALEKVRKGYTVDCNGKYTMRFDKETNTIHCYKTRDLHEWVESSLDEVINGDWNVRTYDQILFRRIKDFLNLDKMCRVKTVLRNEEIVFFGDLVKREERELAKFCNFGKKSLDALKFELASVGLSLGRVLSKDEEKELEEAKLVEKEFSEEELIELCFDYNNVFHGIKNAVKWVKLIDFLRQDACECTDNVYTCPQLEDDYAYIYGTLINCMDRAGIEFPAVFPEELDFDYKANDDSNGSDGPEIWSSDIIRENKIGSVIYDFFVNYLYINSFKAAFVDDVVEQLIKKNDGFIDIDLEFDFKFAELAFSKLKLDLEFAPTYGEVEKSATEEINNALSKVIKHALDNNILVDFSIDQIISSNPGKLDALADSKANGILGVTNSSTL